MKATRILMILAGLQLASPVAVQAQTQRAAAPNAQLTQQLQQLASERTALQAESARLKAELEKVRKERDDLRKSRDAVEQRGRSAEAVATRGTAERERLSADLEREKARMQELVGRFRETATQLRDIETDRTAAKQTLAQRDQELKACVVRNTKLYDLNQEILAKLDDRGFWSSLASREPFTQIKRVQLENLVDGYRDRALDGRPPEGAAAPGPAPAP